MEANNSKTGELKKNEYNRGDSNISPNSKCGNKDVKKDNKTEQTAMGTKPNTKTRPPSRIPRLIRAPIAPRENIITPVATSRTNRLQAIQPNRSQGPIKPFSICAKKSGASINSEVQLNARERVAENNRFKVFESLRKNVRDMQTEFLSKLASLKLSSPDKIMEEYKLISIVKNDECKLMVHDDFLTKFPKMIPSETVGDLRQKIRTFMDKSVMNLEKDIRTYAIKDPRFGSKLEETIKSLKADKERRLQEINEYITQLSTQYHDDNIDPIIENLTKELDATKQVLQDSQNKMQVQISANEQEKADLKAKLTQEFKDMICKKEQELEKIQFKAVELEHINKELKAKDNKLGTDKQENELTRENEELVNQKIYELECSMLKEKEEKLAKVTIIENLSADLEAALEKIKKGKFHQKETLARVDQLKQKVRQQKEALESLEMQKVSMQNQVDKLKAETENVALFEKELEESKIHIEELGQDILKLNTAIETLTAESNTELNKLRESEAAKIREIDELKSELTKCERIISQLKEEKLGDRQLLNVRSELINTLQKEQNNQRNQLERKTKELLEKDNNIQELNSELLTHSDEFRNLFKRLRNKESELARQTQLTTLMVECNDRNQKLRVRQESKVSNMEDQILHLKEAISYYQANVFVNHEPSATSIDPASTSRGAPAQDEETPDRAEHARDGRNRKRNTKTKVQH